MYEYLITLVKEHTLVPKEHNILTTGGIVPADWCYGAVFMASFLAHVASFSPDVVFSRYLLCVIFYSTLPPPDLSSLPFLQESFLPNLTHLLVSYCHGIMSPYIYICILT